jgi:glycosyltransferase involved in cell wall biosynthesis
MTHLVQVRPNALLIIAGSAREVKDRKYLSQLLELVDELNLGDTVQFHSKFIPEGRIPYYFAAASIVLLPYAESVGASGPAHSYAAFGVPIVASDVGYHMAETLGGNLTLFEQGNPINLAKKLDVLLSNRERAKLVGEKIRDYAETETWQKAAKRTLENYRDTMVL